jgi:uncharacterized membrane protein YgcG
MTRKKIVCNQSIRNRKNFFLYFVFSALFLTTSCMKEDLEENNSQSNKRIVKRITLEEFQKNKAAFAKYEQIATKKSNVQGKMVYNELYDFYVDTSSILYIENGNYNSMTFPIYRDESTENIHENLFLHLQPNGEYFSYILRYNLTNQDIFNHKNGLPIANLSSKTTIIVIDDFDSSTLLNRGGCVPEFVANFEYQVVTTQVPINNGDLTGEFGYETVTTYVVIGVTYTYIGCTGGGGTGGDGGSSSGSGGPFGSGGGGSGSGGTNPVGNDPEFGIQIRDKNVEYLNKLTNYAADADNSIPDYIDELTEKLSAPLEEEGAEFRKNGSNYAFYPVLNVGYNYVRFNAAVTNSLVRIHKHHVELDPIPSIEDVFGFAEFFKQKKDLNASDKNNITSIVVTEKGLFAMRVEDETKLEQFRNLLNNKETKTKFIEDFYNDVTDKARKDCLNCSEAQIDNLLQTYFMNFLNKLSTDHGLGISIYKGLYEPLTGKYSWFKI